MQEQRQVTFASLLGALALSACVPIPIVIAPGAMMPVREWPVREWPASATCPVPARSAADGPRLVALMNAERGKAGLKPLVLSTEISAVAHAFACEIAARGDIDHTGTDGSKLSERLQRGGVLALMVAENTAYLYPNPEAAMAAWMASPGHRENILRPEARAVGVGQADGGEVYWVVDFTS